MYQLKRVAAYQLALRDLKEFDNETLPIIKYLTNLAKENIAIAPLIVETVEERLQKVPGEEKYPVLLLIDSILQNVGGNYVDLFTQNIVSMFWQVFKKPIKNIRSELFKLRKSWKDFLPSETLYKLDLKMQTLDPAWPIFPVSGPKSSLAPAPSSSKKLDIFKELDQMAKKVNEAKLKHEQILAEMEQQSKQQQELERQKDLERQKELERQKDLERQKELERQKDLERQKELERQKDLERQKALEQQKKLERRQKTFERQQVLKRQEELEEQQELQRQQKELEQQQKELKRQQNELEQQRKELERQRKEFKHQQKEFERQKELKEQQQAPVRSNVPATASNATIPPHLAVAKLRTISSTNPLPMRPTGRDPRRYKREEESSLAAVPACVPGSMRPAQRDPQPQSLSLPAASASASASASLPAPASVSVLTEPFSQKAPVESPKSIQVMMMEKPEKKKKQNKIDEKRKECSRDEKNRREPEVSHHQSSPRKQLDSLNNGFNEIDIMVEKFLGNSISKTYIFFTIWLSVKLFPTRKCS